VHILFVLGCIECMRCRLLLPMFAVSIRQSVRPSVCQSACHAAQLGGACSMCGEFAAAFAKLLWTLVVKDLFHAWVMSCRAAESWTYNATIFRLHRVHKIGSIAIYDPGRLSVCHATSRHFSVHTRLNACTKTSS